jgi:hypothetical protein
MTYRCVKFWAKDRKSRGNGVLGQCVCVCERERETEREREREKERERLRELVGL